ncbi:hypothetical protein CFP65_7580 [Kitasatospora sp. MMS16-BH015]|uniref:hypothetical protein n=1 Tax=Kitasatospora sp. MMS16-BH015 TaxID=2018025 RepID=UPI000CA37AD4|nr:hypothetical protein [Kitasatospora sp. MMS16-BH015]AUG82151.1 hypothetical protein CFP65_7580 [Kitasatospora sp. MMS16-BH015]
MGWKRGRDSEQPDPEQVAEELAALAVQMERGPAGEPVVVWHQRGRQRARELTTSVGGLLAKGGVAAGRGGKALADRLLEAAPRIPVRDLATLRAQHPDAATPEELADRLVLGACRAAGAVGASIGAAAMLPVPPAMPVELAAEALAVAAVEIKLIAELHEVYGRPPSGTRTQRAGAYVTAWAERRGIDGAMLVAPASLAAVALGAEVRQKVRRRLVHSSLRRLPSLTPLLVGAGVGAVVNRRDTRKLAGEVRADLTGREPLQPDYWAAALPG